jgi:hypothetical protein
MHPYLMLSVSPYPNSALSAGELAIIAIVPVLAMTVWLFSIFLAAGEPRWLYSVFLAARGRRHRGGAATTSLPQLPRVKEQQREEPEHKAA